LKLLSDYPKSGMDIPAAGNNSVAETRKICKYSIVQVIVVQFGTAR
jgi:hypothetical protein